MEKLNFYLDYKFDFEEVAPVLSTSDWVSQFPSAPSLNGDGRGLLESEKTRPGKPNDWCCYDAAMVMTQIGNGNPDGAFAHRIRTLLRTGSGDLHVMGEQAQLGAKVIDQTLKNGLPVFIGVERQSGSLNEDGKTEHFVVIMEKKIIDGEIYYRFFDPGTSYGSKGYSTENLLHLNMDSYALSGTSKYNEQTRTYNLSQVRFQQ